MFTAHPSFHPAVHGGTIVLSESLDDVENAFQEAVSGSGDAAVRGHLHPVGVRRLAGALGQARDVDVHPVVPDTYADAPDEAALADYADRVIARVEAVAPGFTDSVLHRQVIGPHEMQEEYGLVGVHLPRRAVARAAVPRPASGLLTPTCAHPCAGCTRRGQGRTGAAASPGSPARNVVRQILADQRAERWRRRLWRGSSA